MTHTYLRMTGMALALTVVSIMVNSGTAAADDPQYGGAIIVGVPGNQTNLNSATYPRTFSGQLISINMFDGLLRSSKFGDGVDTPALATSWDVSADGLKYTFRLRDDVTWHDGEAFTSADVEFTIFDVAMPHHPQGQSNFEVVESIETPDAHTVVFNLKRPDASFLSKLDPKFASIAPKHILEGQDIANSDYNWAPVGTGPFKFVEWVRGSHIILEKNENYWATGQNGDSLPYLDRLIFKIVPNASTLLASLEAGEIDFIHSFPGVVPLAEVGRLNMPGTGIKAHTFSYANKALDFLFMNTRGEKTSDPQVRRAIAHLVNTDEIIDKVFSGVAEAVRQEDSGFMTWYTGTVPESYYPFDPTLAEELLDAAGYSKNADGMRFTLNFTINQNDGYVQKMVDIMRTDFQAAGIGFDVKVYDVATLTEKVHNQLDYDLHVTAIATGPDPDLLTKSWHSDNIGKGWNNNSTAYSNPTVDNLLEQGRTTIDPEARKLVYAEVQDILMDEIPMLPITEALWLWTYNENLGGFPIGYTFRDGLETVHWKGEVPANRR